MSTDHPQAEMIAKLAEEKLNMKLGVRKELRKLTDLLGENEDVLNLARGQYDGKTGLVVVTDRRVLFTEQGLMRARLEDFPYDKISSVQTSSGMVGGSITIYASGNKAEIKDIYPKQRSGEIGDYIRQRIGGGGHAAPAAAPTAASAAPPTPDTPVEQLKKLGELRDAGILTPEEFDAKKAEILARM